MSITSRRRGRPTKVTPELEAFLLEVLRRPTHQTTRKIAEEARLLGHDVSREIVAKLFGKLDPSNERPMRWRRGGPTRRKGVGRLAAPRLLDLRSALPVAPSRQSGPC